MMNKLNRTFRRALSFVVICMIVLTTLSPSFSVSTTAEETVVTETSSQKIDKFDINLIGGAAFADPNYVCTPASVDEGIEFARYQIDYSISAGEDGGGDIAPGDFRITLPKHVFKNRSGIYTDVIEMSVPELSEVSDDDNENTFVYIEQGDNIVIYNRLKMSSADGGSIQFRYSMGERVYEYVDGSSSDSVRAELRISKSQDENLYTYDSAPGMTLDTFATLTSTTKDTYYSHTHYTNWNNSWGDPSDFGISNPEDYYYVVWRVIHYVNATQPFTFEYTESVTGDYGTADFVGVKWYNNAKYTPGLISPVIKLKNTLNNEVINCVLTKHPKADYPNDATYHIQNKVDVVLDPVDQVDPDTTGTASAVFTYNPPTPWYPTYGASFWKYNHFDYYPYRDYIANYQLDEFLDGDIDEISENIDYHVHSYGNVYPLTFVDDGYDDENKYQGYGKKPVTYVITDDQFYFNDSITNANNIPEGSELLTSADFEITSLRYSYSANGAVWNEETLRFDTTAATYSDEDAVFFYAKFNDNTDWTSIGTYHLKSGQCEIQSDKVSGFTNGNITFTANAGCVGYKIITSNAFYYTGIHARPYCTIKKSDRILGLINGVTATPRKVWMTNVANGKIYNCGIDGIDNEENVYFSRNDYAKDYIIGVEKDTSLKKSSTFVTNNKLKRIATVGWRVDMFEGYMTQTGQAYIPQDSGTFYDLIPAGGEVDLGTVAVATGVGKEISYLSESQYDVSKIMNYNNSGRTLLIVKVKKPTSTGYVLTYSTLHSWESLFDYTAYARNSVVYETGNSKLAKGRPDDGGTITDAPLLVNLDPDTDAARFAYSEYTHKIDILLAVNCGLNKRVKSYYDDDYKKSTIVRQNQIYSYRLRFSTDFSTKAKGLIMVDNLESFTSEEEGIENLWNGTLDSVDVSLAAAKGIAPVVYLSESTVEVGEGVNILADSKWKTMDTFGDISKAKAIAIDLRKKADGSDFTLGANDSVVVYLYMLSASRDPVEGETHAAPQTHNSVHMYSTLLSAFDSEFSEPRFTTWSYDTVDFRIMSDLKIQKLDATDHTTPVEGISFRLEGTSAYGTEYDSVLASDSSGYLTFKDIEMGTYRLTEYKGSSDYLMIDGTMEVVVNDDGSITVDGERVTEGMTYKIDDPPRIHTDISFNKKDLRNKWKVIPGVRFHLEGTSDYGNEINLDAVSDDDGIVTFEDVELGSYKMKEISTVEGYILSKTEYDVKVDQDALFTISESTVEKDGTLTIYNEPFHSFTIHKESFKTELPVKGASFNLSGTSDYGTKVDTTKVTRTNGNATFSDLEAGTYILREVEAPEGYILDPTDYVVTIPENGSVSIFGAEKDSNGYFVFKNKDDSNVTITKEWVDKKTNNTRTAEPTIRLGQKDTSKSAYFGSTLRPVINDTYLSYVKNFEHYDGDEEDVQTLIDNGTAKKIDDGTTDNNIYAWYINSSSASDYQTVYWWSDVSDVYLLDGQDNLWINLTECTSIDLTGINFTKETDLSHLFFGCKKLTTIIGLDSINASDIEDMSYMFYNCNALSNDSINYILNWDTSNVKNMSNMFNGCTALTSLDLSGWNTSNVTDMSYMFYNCNKLTSINLNGWDTAKVKDMSYMFNGCTALTSLDLSGWNTSNVTDMSYMFYNCNKLTSINLNGWDTAKVKDMSYMFNGCTALTSLDISGWTASNAEDMSYMFYNCSKLTALDVSGWNTSSVTDMSSMFRFCSALTTLDVSGWDTSHVKDMSYMFNNCTALATLGVSELDTSHVKDMSYMFNNCTALATLDVSGWNTSNVTDMSYMFYNCKLLTDLDVSAWDTSKVTNMKYMFGNCSGLTPLDVKGWDTSKVTDMSYMFYYCTGLTSLDFGDYPVTAGEKFNTSNVTNMSNMFSGCSNLRTVDLHCFNTSKVTDMNNMFSDVRYLSDLSSLSGWDTSSVVNMSHMFNKITGSTSDHDFSDVDSLANWNTSNVTDMSYMFGIRACLTDISGLSNWNTSNVKNMSHMFYACSSLSDISPLQTTVSGLKVSWDVSNVKNMSGMFNSCSSLTNLSPISGWKTSCVTNMSYMFSGCSSLTNLSPISSWKTSCVTNMSYMFSGCSSLTNLSPISSWDTSNVTAMKYLFANCTSLTDLTPISSWKTSSVTDMNHMFNNCTSLSSVDGLENWNTSSVTNMSYTFYNCNSLTDISALSDWNTSSVTDMSYTFYYCTSLTDISALSSWNTSKLSNMYFMFSGCNITDVIPIKDWNTSSVTNMTYVFYHCYSLTSFEVNWDTSKVTSMTAMFFKCTNITSIDLSSFNTSSVKNTEYMFRSCGSLVKIYVSDRWDMSKVTNSNEMFSYCGNLNSDGGATKPSEVGNKSDKTYACIYVAPEGDSSGTPGYLRYKEAPTTSGGSSTGTITGVAYILSSIYSSDTNSVKLSSMTLPDNIAFKHYDNTNNDALTAYENASIKMELDDGTTACNVYAWFDSSDITVYKTEGSTNYESVGTVFWWSDADVVYLKHSGTTSLWKDNSKFTYIDVSGLNITKLYSLERMFANCTNVVTIDGLETWYFAPDKSYIYLKSMFFNCQKLENLDGLSDWDASIVSDRDDMFYNCKSLKNVDFLRNWRPKSSSSGSMFFGCSSLENVDGLTDWNLNLSSYRYMFYGCSSLKNINGLRNWCSTNTTADTYGMFQDCTSLSNIDAIKNWKNKFFREMSYMFYGCTSLEDISALSSLSLTYATTMEYMFRGCTSLTDVSVINDWDLRSVTTMRYMFYGCTDLTSVTLNNPTLTKLTDMQYMFSNCYKSNEVDGDTGLTNVNIINWNTPELTQASSLFSGDRLLETVTGLENWKTGKVTNMSYMFQNCTSLVTVSGLKDLDTRSLVNAEGMFSGCSSITSIDVSGWDTPSLTNISRVFGDCTSLTTISGINGWNTSKVSSFSSLFINCSNLTELDVSKWNTSSVTSCDYVFKDCSRLKALDLRGWNTANVTSMVYMFYNCNSLKTIEVSDMWNTDKVTSYYYMFYNCTALEGGDGTKFDSSKTGKEYAVIDEKDVKKGYLTYKEYIRIIEVDNSGNETCTLEKVDDKTWRYTFTGLTPGVKYYAWEDDIDKYTSINMISNKNFAYAEVANGIATITNTADDPPAYGSLKVTKDVKNKDGTDITSATDKAKDFLFTVKLTDAENGDLTGGLLLKAVKTSEGEDSDISVYFVNGSVSFRLADDEAITILDVPADYHYTVTETADEDYDSSSEGTAGIIEEDKTSSAAFTNTKNYEEIIEEDFVTFSLKNVVTGNVTIDSDEQFPYTIYLDNLKPDAYYSMIKNGEEVVFKSTSSGTAFIELGLTNGELVSLTVPVDSSYTIKDLAGDYVASYSITDSSGANNIKKSADFNTEENKELSTRAETADKGEEILVTFTNVRTVAHDLTIQKVVAGTASDSTNDQFEFSVSLSGLTPGTVLTSTFGRLRAENDGTLLVEGFSLRDGDSIVINDIPAGVHYDVTEGKSSYIASYVIKHGETESEPVANTTVQTALSTGDHQIPTEDDVVVVFTNTKTACDITITNMIDMTYGNLLKDEYSKTEFKYDITLSQSDVAEGSQLKYNEIIVKYTKENTTGADEMTLAELLGMTETQGNETFSSKDFTITLHHGESFTITNLSLDMTCMVEEQAMGSYIASYTTESNDGAVLQADLEKANAEKNTALDITIPEKVDAADRVIRFVFTNEYIFEPYVLPESGTNDIRPMLTILFSGMLAFAALYYAANRRKKAC